MAGAGAEPGRIRVGAAIFGTLFCLGGMGMGDVKLCAAVGAWIGPSQLMIALVITGLAGGIMAVCWAASRGFLGSLFAGSAELIFGLKERGLRPHAEMNLSNPRAHKMPYAPAIAIGTSFFVFRPLRASMLAAARYARCDQGI